MFVYLIQRFWNYLLRRSWRQARVSLRVYQALAEREPRRELRATLLQLAGSQERRADRQAQRLRKLCAPLPEDRDRLGERMWRWLLVRCGSRWALAWIDLIEDFDLFLSTAVTWLTARVAAWRARAPH